MVLDWTGEKGELGIEERNGKRDSLVSLSEPRGSPQGSAWESGE